ncbi:MAG: hypothetical protein K940chlam2_01261 [Chlamydiae bacterium]|nr:hypothetical protein [Chlamydiota bacterium]
MVLKTLKAPDMASSAKAMQTPMGAQILGSSLFNAILQGYVKLFLGAHDGEEEDVADGVHACEEHGETVEANT